MSWHEDFDISGVCSRSQRSTAKSAAEMAELVRRHPEEPGDEMLDVASAEKQTPAAPAVAGESSNCEDSNDNPALYEFINDFAPEILRGKYSTPPGVNSNKSKLDLTLPPMHQINEIFDDIALKAKEAGIESFLDHIGSRKLKVATMCSGTEAPVMALEMFIDRTFFSLVDL